MPGSDAAPQSRVWSIGIVFVGVLQFSLSSILAVKTKGVHSYYGLRTGTETLHLASIMLMAELLAIACILGGIFIRGKGWLELKSIDRRRILHFAVPAVLHSLSNEMALLCLKYMDAGTFQTLANMKIFSTAILYGLVLKNKIDPYAQMSLALLFLGACVAANSVTHEAAEVGRARHQFFLENSGLILVTLYTLLSALGTVLSEKLFKQVMKKSDTRGNFGFSQTLSVKNLQICIWALLFSAMHCVMESGSIDVLMPSNLLKGFNSWTWALIANQAGMTIVLAAVIYYMNSVRL
jgi:uncharacterized membrane protein|tara:strand:+ start:166 stop:1047 length:882 start_codon:yes stop_codon:yes gene_type:complete